MEKTLSIIKPDAVERNLEGKITEIFFNNSLKIQSRKKIKITKEEASEFYLEHQTKPFFEKLCEYLSSGPIIVMILEGENAISKSRKILGATNPAEADPETIRNLYGLSIDKNSVHGSDSLESAEKEIKFFFKK